MLTCIDKLFHNNTTKIFELDHIRQFILIIWTNSKYENIQKNPKNDHQYNFSLHRSALGTRSHV